MSSAASRADRPTPRQLAYLRSLANRVGQTFTHPRTRQQASREIERLKKVRPSSVAELEIEREIADAITQGEKDAARVRESEVTGYASTATWKDRS